MTVGGNTLRFTYDALGMPLTVTYNGTTYYYSTNVQGDIIAILDATGNSVVQYVYDAWGNIRSAAGTLASTLGAHNPLRYRGYVYDNETALYYLQSRYYNPEIGRFLNADALASTGQGLAGNNMFAYCGNNPAIYCDPTGRFLEEVWDWIVDSIKEQHEQAKEKYKKVKEKIDTISNNILEDIKNYDENNTDTSKVFSANYFSSYKGTPVLRLRSKLVTSWAIAGTIFLNKENNENLTPSRQAELLNHEYGHILQEKILGPAYMAVIAIPSVIYNYTSRGNPVLNSNYYNMPWEYCADVLGGVERNHANWALPVAIVYFGAV